MSITLGRIDYRLLHGIVATMWAPQSGAQRVMVIDDKLIQYLEDLSRLHLTEEEKEKSKEELGKILNYVDMLNELDTTGVEEMSHPFNFTNNFREDEAVNTENREALLANAPEQKDGCFKVPQTVE